jgi:hypothetical protein
MRRCTLIQLAILEAYALILANIQALGGVRTDEAKYLLNIPYPHPPAGRWFFHAFEFLPFQEMFWRVILASLLVHAVWLVWDLARGLPSEGRYAVGGAWLLSSALMLQGGSVLMAPVTALQVLLLLWLGSHPTFVKRFPGLIGLVWFASLFTAIQAILFLPIVWGVLRRSGVSMRDTILFALGPVAVFALYLPTNTFFASSVLLHGGRGAGETLIDRIQGTLRVGMLAGGGVISLIGTAGLLRSMRGDLLLSFLLLTAYVFVSRYDYYAILFLPLFMIGAYELFLRLKHFHLKSVPFLACFVLGSVVTFLLARPPKIPGPAEGVIDAIVAKGHTGSLMIVGSFGHEWQYYSRAPVLKYSDGITIPEDTALVCLEDCERGITQGRGVVHVEEVEVYLK